MCSGSESTTGSSWCGTLGSGGVRSGVVLGSAAGAACVGSLGCAPRSAAAAFLASFSCRRRSFSVRSASLRAFLRSFLL